MSNGIQSYVKMEEPGITDVLIERRLIYSIND